MNPVPCIGFLWMNIMVFQRTNVQWKAAVRHWQHYHHHHHHTRNNKYLSCEPWQARTDKRKCDAATLQPLSRFNYQQPTATLTHQPNTIMIMIDLHCHHHCYHHNSYDCCHHVHCHHFGHHLRRHHKGSPEPTVYYAHSNQTFVRQAAPRLHTYKREATIHHSPHTTQCLTMRAITTTVALKTMTTLRP